MASSTKKWLTGCGIGCGLIVVIIGGIGTWGFFTIKDVVHRADDLDTAQAELDSLLGPADSYTPRPDGTVDPLRMEAFLAVQQNLAGMRADLAANINAMDGKGPGGVIAKVRGRVKLVPAIFDFVESRNTALLQQQMNAGEYHHLQSLAWFALLGKDPADGPGFSMVNEDQKKDDDNHVVIRKGIGKSDSLRVRRQRDRAVRRMVNRQERTILANQLAALDARPDLLEAMPGWRDTLAAEVEAMNRSERRLPWQDGLPNRIAGGLEPYRDRLEQYYEPMTMAVELGLAAEN